MTHFCPFILDKYNRHVRKSILVIIVEDIFVMVYILRLIPKLLIHTRMI